MVQIVTANRLIDGTGAASKENAAIVVDRGKIVEISQQPPPAEGADLISLGDVTLLPGFVDTHIHVTGDGTLDAREHLATDTDEVLLMRGVASCERMLRAGVTTARDCGSRNEVIFPLKAALKSGIVRGPRLKVAGAVITTTGGHAYIFGRETDGEADIRKAVREQFKRGADFIKVMLTGGILTQFRPNLLQYDLSEFSAAVDEATKLGLHVAAHCHNKAGIQVAVAGGARTIEHGIYLDHEGVRYDASLGQKIRESGMFVNPSHAFAVRAILTGETPTATDEGPEFVAKLREERVLTWQQQYSDGVRLVPGSDAGWYATPFEDYMRMPELMVEEIGMSPMEAIVACTQTAADAIEEGSDVGTLEPGKHADIIAVEGNPLEDIRALWNVHFVMIGGEAVHPLPKSIRTEIWQTPPSWRGVQTVEA